MIKKQYCTFNVTARNQVDRCPCCDHDQLILIHMPDVRVRKGNRQWCVNDCPYCNTRNSLTLLGFRPTGPVFSTAGPAGSISGPRSSR